MHPNEVEDFSHSTLPSLEMSGPFPPSELDNEASPSWKPWRSRT